MAHVLSLIVVAVLLSPVWVGIYKVRHITRANAWRREALRRDRAAAQQHRQRVRIYGGRQL